MTRYREEALRYKEERERTRGRDPEPASREPANREPLSREREPRRHASADPSRDPKAGRMVSWEADRRERGMDGRDAKRSSERSMRDEGTAVCAHAPLHVVGFAELRDSLTGGRITAAEL